MKVCGKKCPQAKELKSVSESVISLLVARPPKLNDFAAWTGTLWTLEATTADASSLCDHPKRLEGVQRMAGQLRIYV